ncbi:MAG TPA: hypothetical protein VMW92_00190 [Candidatus Heimdallarchaeota archaeon]|nr:hypothetical protein [Candidatus Heimdallarchaeota archaeon]
MTAARKIIALLIIIFMGIPILFGVIWFVGLTKATVSPEFLTDLPREIIADVPEMAEEIFTEAQSERVITDENTRAWFRAAAEAGVTPIQVMEETGLQDWLRNELSETLRETGEVLRGKRRPKTIVLDLRPLKEILLRDDIDRYMIRILEQLPSCDEEGTQAWTEFSEEDWTDEWPPACRPDLDIAQEILKYERIEAVSEMEEEIEIFEDVRFIPFGISRVITWFSYSLFLIPAFFIFIGALIAATSPASFFRWTGVSILFAAIPALLLSFFVKSVSLWALNFVPYSYSHTETWSAELSDLIMEKISWIPVKIIEFLFSPVVAVSGTVCIIGLVIFVISFMVRDRIQTRIVERQIVAPAPEATEKPPLTEEAKEPEIDSEEPDKKEE